MGLSRLVTLPSTLTGMALAVTPVNSELSLMAAAVAMALATRELVLARTLESVSSAGDAARMATPLIIKSPMPRVLIWETVSTSARALVLTVLSVLLL